MVGGAKILRELGEYEAWRCQKYLARSLVMVDD